MAIDLHSETLLEISEVPSHAPCPRGKRVHISTVWRWITRGVHNGIKLETAVCGGRRLTSREALERFFQATTAAADGVTATGSALKRPDSRIEIAERELESEGI